MCDTPQTRLPLFVLVELNSPFSIGTGMCFCFLTTEGGGRKQRACGREGGWRIALMKAE